MDAFRADSRSRDELIELIMQEMKRVRDKLTELKVQIDQTQIVVDREQQRSTDVITELRTIQDNIETMPRQDIRAKYDEALDVRNRLSTMRGQLEKFQSTREHLEREQSLLSGIMNRLQGIDALPASGAVEVEGVGGKGALNIVRIITAQEEERQRLARQMHDGPAQSLTNFILQTEICQRLFDRNPQRAAEELDNLKNVASVTFQKVRDFIFDLRPMMLDDLGVIPTVRRYVDSFKEKNDIEVRLDITGEERRLQTHREVMIFRSIQELMGQARDYASASEIEIKLDMSGSPIRIQVEDNGRGFDAEEAFTSTDEHVQDPRIQVLTTLRERFELVGGKASIVSKEAEGTSVRMELPDSD
ncbi:MAG: putative two-component sensor histidine kinase [Chloroflexi bacterium OLB15]|nr:MAG: putative two-component sensor histidine kinase [Chloroflexi bacterium OLB15]